MKIGDKLTQSIEKAKVGGRNSTTVVEQKVRYYMRDIGMGRDSAAHFNSNHKPQSVFVGGLDNERRSAQVKALN